MDLSEAVVFEILETMKANGIASLNELGRLSGFSQQAIHFRLGTGNPKTGQRVDLDVDDLEKIASALGDRASLLLARAEMRQAFEKVPAAGSKQAIQGQSQ